MPAFTNPPSPEAEALLLMRNLWDVEMALHGPQYSSIPAVLGSSWVSIIDLEFDAAKQRAYEVAITTLHKQRSKGLYYFPVPNTWLIDPEQEQLNWATVRRAQLKHGTLDGVGNFRQHFPRLQRLLRRTQVLVGWNIGNDRNILEAECRRNGFTYGEMKWVDLGQMYKMLRSETSVPTLSQACGHYGIVRETDEAHYAIFDAIATAELTGRICDEWLAQMSGRAEELQISISGFLGNGGWDPRLNAVDIHPASVRTPPGAEDMRRYLQQRDAQWRWREHVRIHYPQVRNFEAWQEMDPHIKARLKEDYARIRA